MPAPARSPGCLLASIPLPRDSPPQSRLPYTVFSPRLPQSPSLLRCYRSSDSPCCTHSGPVRVVLTSQKSFPDKYDSTPRSISPRVPAPLPMPRETHWPKPGSSSRRRTPRPYENSPATGSAEYSTPSDTVAPHRNISLLPPILHRAQWPHATADWACSSTPYCSDRL